MRTRRAPTDDRIRPLESYIVSLEEALAQEMPTSRSRFARLRLAAAAQGQTCRALCLRLRRRSQRAVLGGEQRGACFSYYLLDSLQRSGEALSYRDLFKRVDALVRGSVNQQSPQIEATLPDELDQPFLGGAVSGGKPTFTASIDKRIGWVIDGGTVHGIPPVSGDESTLLALFPFDARQEEMRELSNSLGEALVQKVYGARSKVAITMKDGSQPSPKTTYKAVVTSLPLPPIAVSLEGDKAALELIRTAMQHAAPDKGTFTAGQRSRQPTKATLRLIAADNGYRIQRSADAYPMAVDTPEFTEASAKLAVQRLEHIARWSKISELSNPTSRLPANAVKMELFEVDSNGNEQPLDSTQEIRLPYRQVGDEWQARGYKVKLTNPSSQPLYCMLVGLTQSFQVYTEFLVGGNIELKPGQNAWAWDGDPIYAQVSDELWQQGSTESKDTLKLIVSSEPADASLLKLDALPITVTMPKLRTVDQQKTHLNVDGARWLT